MNLTSDRTISLGNSPSIGGEFFTLHYKAVPAPSAPPEPSLIKKILHIISPTFTPPPPPEVLEPLPLPPIPSPEAAGAPSAWAEIAFQLHIIDTHLVAIHRYLTRPRWYNILWAWLKGVFHVA